MIALECVIARMTSQTWVPAFIQGGGTVLQQVFSQGSAHDIALALNLSSIAVPLAGNQSGFWAYDLHMATQALTKNPPAPQRSQRIAVLLADHYNAYPAALGIMFDRGFDPGDDPNSNKDFTSSPREGCAIFLGAIAQLRKTPALAEQEALFTTIHEMGHLFNLPHVVAQPPHFLSQSSPLAPYGPNAYHFLGPHAFALSKCSQSPAVWPGGSPFGDTADFANVNIPPPRKARSEPFGLELVIDMAQREFWAFEPVELDVELRVAPGTTRGFRVPDMLDHGYDNFDVWLEEPDGERRRVRSPRLYCGPVRSRTIRPGRSFRRDISLFGEAGGYTFRRAGVHQIWAEFRPRGEAVIVSNRIQVNIRPRDGGESYEVARRLLASPRGARTLYHRLPIVRAKEMAALERYCRTNPDLGSAGSVSYALGRALLRLPDDSHRLRGRELLKRAAQDHLLGHHQRALAIQAIAHP
jgi:hypothetical protein